MSCRPLRRTAVLVAAGLLLLGAMACGRNGSASGKVDVVTAFYPLQFIAERIGGDAVAVTNLAKPGAEPHDMELEPRQLAQIADAALVAYLKGFQPAVDEAVAQEAKDSAFDAASVEPLAGGDVHIWLDPSRLATVGDKLADRLAAVDPAHAPDYRTRAAAVRKDLENLDREYADGLRTCQRREIVTSHAAFGYLAARYQLRQIPITGLSPEEEPLPQRLAEVAAEARRYGATTIFFETLVSPKVAEAVAREVGATTAVLDPVEGLEPGSTEDYVAVMRANLATLQKALGCT
ncbi:MAG TPA: metal ABC transporter substrate-binding protein [Micromonosporaceae bacterium]|nr:metal ABC transporter substrate-binding protein [Micromonosporaceae bacterium]